jgi:hypothetical protein
MICESKLDDGYYWVYFENHWQLLNKNEWWFDDYSDNVPCEKVNGCVCVPIKEPDFTP